MRFFTVGIQGALGDRDDFNEDVQISPGVVFPVEMKWTTREDALLDWEEQHNTTQSGPWRHVPLAMFGVVWGRGERPSLSHISGELLTNPGGGAVLLPSWQQMLQRNRPGGLLNIKDAPAAVLVTRASVAETQYLDYHGYELIPEVGGSSAVFIRVTHDPELWEESVEADYVGEINLLKANFPVVGFDCAILTSGQHLNYKLRFPDCRRTTNQKFLDVRVGFDGKDIWWTIDNGEKYIQRRPDQIIA